jgi:ketosteroid isomerase-like protein
MSRENVEVVRRANALGNAGEYESFFEVFDRDIEFRDLQHAPDLPELIRGLDALREMAANWTEVYDEFRAEIREYIDAHPWVICDARWYGRGKGSDVEIDLRVADVYEVRDGKIVRAIIGYPDPATALKAVRTRDTGRAMSEHLDLVRSILAAWGRGDYSAADWAHPEIEFDSPLGVEIARTRGVEEMAKAWRATMSAYDDLRTEADEFRELDRERVLVLYSLSGHSKLSGLDVAPTGTKGALLFHVRDGRVTRLIVYVDRERGLADLGLQG